MGSEPTQAFGYLLRVRYDVQAGINQEEDDRGLSALSRRMLVINVLVCQTTYSPKQELGQ